MRCPFCGYEDTKVIDSRPTEGKKRRRRECISCGKRFTTYEVIEAPLLMIAKKDGTYEPFDRNKLIQGIYSAIKKRPVSMETVNRLVDNIENHYVNAMQTQVKSTEIGDLVLAELRRIDLVAYVRFASVYKDFSDVQSFVRIISELSERPSIEAPVSIKQTKNGIPYISSKK